MGLFAERMLRSLANLSAASALLIFDASSFWLRNSANLSAVDLLVGISLPGFCGVMKLIWFSFSALRCMYLLNTSVLRAELGVNATLNKS